MRSRFSERRTTVPSAEKLSSDFLKLHRAIESNDMRRIKEAFESIGHMAIAMANTLEYDFREIDGELVLDLCILSSNRGESWSCYLPDGCDSQDATIRAVLEACAEYLLRENVSESLALTAHENSIARKQEFRGVAECLVLHGNGDFAVEISSHEVSRLIRPSCGPCVRRGLWLSEEIVKMQPFQLPDDMTRNHDWRGPLMRSGTLGAAGTVATFICSKCCMVCEVEWTEERRPEMACLISVPTPLAK